MKSDIMQNMFREKDLNIEKAAVEKLLTYAEMIHETNQKFNLTGFKTVEDIIKGLIIDSIIPIRDIIVPRGTKLVDIGTGAGIPGIPILIYNPDFTGLLIDSNNKKTDFLQVVKEKLQLNNAEIINGRVEEAARATEYREKFDWCFSRAYSKNYVTIETGAPFVVPDGILYIYSKETASGLPESILNHSKQLGLNVMSHDEISRLRLPPNGICFRKQTNTPDKFPRKYAVIKRNAERVEK